MGKRRYVRFGTRRAVRFSGKDIEGDGQLLNISLGGCAVESPVSVTKGSLLQLEVNISEQDSPMLVALAAVRWADSGRFGIEFLGIDHAPQQQLRRFVAALKADYSPTSPAAA